MDKEDCTFTSPKNFTNEEKFDIALKYIDYCTRLAFFRMVSSDDNKIKNVATVSALSAMYHVLSNEDNFIRCAVELQLAEGSPLWDLELPF